MAIYFHQNQINKIVFSDMAAILIEETKRFTFTKDNFDIYLFRYQIILGMVRFTKIVQNTLRVLFVGFTLVFKYFKTVLN